MAKYFCNECQTQMELIYEDNILLCPECGRSEEISDEEMEDFDGESSSKYCNICEHNDEYPVCKNKCPYDD